MSHYCGIDLHSNNHVVVVIDEEDKRVLEKRLNNDLSLTLKALSPYRESLQGIAVESTFNWYWLVDGLQEHGYDLQLVNTAAVKQYDGLKYSGDHLNSRADFFAWLILNPDNLSSVVNRVQPGVQFGARRPGS